MDWLTEFASYEDAFIKDLKGLINIASIREDAIPEQHAPFGKGCRDALDYMLNLALRDGFKVHDYQGYAGVIEYGEGVESVGVLAHLDVVPVGEGWTKDPFEAQIEQGILFGRGVLDDKGPAMAAYYALKMLKDHNRQFSRKILLILGCDEESGMECMNYYCEHGEIPTLGFTPDADFPVIYGEKGGLHVRLHGDATTVIERMHAGERANIVIGKAEATVKGWNEKYQELFDFYLKSNQLQGKVTIEDEFTTLFIEGVFAHGAMPYNGVNAAVHLLNFIGSAYGDVFAKQLADLLGNWTGKGLGIDFEGAYMGFLTMNVGIVNIEHQHADILLDIRYPNDADVAYLHEQLKQRVKEMQTPLQIDFKVKAEPLFVDPNSNLVTTLTKVYRKYSHDETSANITIGGGTYAKKFKNFVAFGPEFPKRNGKDTIFVGGPHQRDEGIRLKDLYTAIAIYTEAIEELCGQE